MARVVTKEGGRELLAEQDRLLRFVRIWDSEGAEHFLIEVLDDVGRVADSTRFDYDEFPLAASDYSLRVVEMYDSLVAEVTLEIALGMMSFDHEAVEAVLHDDFTQVDFRPIGYPDLDRTGFLEALDAQSDVVRVWLSQAMHAATRDVLVATGSFWTMSFGRWQPLNQAIYLDILEDDQLLRIEMFPQEQLDAALARFAELTSSTGTSDA